MGLESSATTPAGLEATWPLDSDTRREGAAHLRIVKTSLQNATKLINGTFAAKSVFEYAWPIGAMYIGIPNVNSNPDNDIGGTWARAGSVVLDQTNKAEGVQVMSELWVWQRLA